MVLRKSSSETRGGVQLRCPDPRGSNPPSNAGFIVVNPYQRFAKSAAGLVTRRRHRIGLSFDIIFAECYEIEFENPLSFSYLGIAGEPTKIVLIRCSSFVADSWSKDHRIASAANGAGHPSHQPVGAHQLVSKRPSLGSFVA